MNRSLDPREVDALFGAIERRRRVGTMFDRLKSPDFWRELNPQLTISEDPLAPRVTPVAFPSDEARWHAAFIREEGYLQTRPLFDPDEVARLREAVVRIVALGLPSGLAWVYDEFYALMARIEPVLEPMLGPLPLLLTKDAWAFHVVPGSSLRTGFGAYGRHRDYFVDRQFIQGGLPRVVNAWIPLTDVTAMDSCMYVVHPEGDEDFRSDTQDVRLEGITLEDIRALPTPAGSLTAFSTRVVHWGSRSSRFAAGPRISVTCVLQRRDCDPFDPVVVDLTEPLTWDRRFELVMGNLGSTGLEQPRQPPTDRGRS